MASLIQDSLRGSRQAPHDVQSLADLVGLLNPFLLTHPVLQLLLIFVAKEMKYIQGNVRLTNSCMDTQ